MNEPPESGEPVSVRQWPLLDRLRDWRDEIHASAIFLTRLPIRWSGEMPPFPGMGYPLVPGYEAAGEVVEAGSLTGFKAGERVFVPGANCFEDAA